jgi:hypothetical protein
MPFNGFRIEDYEKICKTIKRSKYDTYTLKKYFEEKPENDFIILRHDVDYNISDAIRIAEIELAYGINATYFIRLNNKSTQKKIEQLNSMVSEIGLHYDLLVTSKYNFKDALTIFNDQLNYLNSIINVRTISAHGSSTKKTIGTELLEKINLKPYDIIGEAMLSVDFERLPYYSDAGRTWNSQRNKLYDFPDIITKDYKYIDKSHELCSLISKGYYKAIYISSHPELWAKRSYLNFLKEIKYGSLRFFVKKCIKYIKGESSKSKC